MANEQTLVEKEIPKLSLYCSHLYVYQSLIYIPLNLYGYLSLSIHSFLLITEAVKCFHGFAINT